MNFKNSLVSEMKALRILLLSGAKPSELSRKELSRKAFKRLTPEFPHWRNPRSNIN